MTDTAAEFATSEAALEWMRETAAAHLRKRGARFAASIARRAGGSLPVYPQIDRFAGAGGVRELHHYIAQHYADDAMVQAELAAAMALLDQAAARELQEQAVQVWASTTRDSVQTALRNVDSLLLALDTYHGLPSVSDGVVTAVDDLAHARARLLSAAGAIDRIVEIQEHEVAAAEGSEP